MIGLVLVTHGRLAQELHSVVEHIVGPQSDFETVGISSGDDIDQKRDEIHQKLDKVNKGRGVILLTDMFGGTPSNIAISLLDMNHVEVLAGVNVPLLVKLVSIRHTASLQDAVQAAQEAGRKYINVASNLLAST